MADCQISFVEGSPFKKDAAVCASMVHMLLSMVANCTASLYLEGQALLDNPAPPAVSSAEATAGPASASQPPPAKRQWTAAECLSELKDLKNLWDCGILTEGEFTLSKAKLLRGE